MFLEIIGGILAGGGSLIGLITTLTELNKKPLIVKDEFGAYPWLWIDRSDTYQKRCGFACPKCDEFSLNKKQPPICSCLDYPKGEHFHFKCNSCGYETLMRTKDNP